MDLQYLLDLEEIKQLRYSFSWCLETSAPDELADLFELQASAKGLRFVLDKPAGAVSLQGRDIVIHVQKAAGVGVQVPFMAFVQYDSLDAGQFLKGLLYVGLFIAFIGLRVCAGGH